MIYVIGGIKGGAGKTTVATNLAVLLSYANKDVLFVDADDQESATDFTNWRNERLDGEAGYTAVQLTGLDVRRQVISLAKKYDDIVIDTGGRDTESQRAALTVSDVALFPFGPRSLDIWTAEKLSRLLREVNSANPKLKSYAFINRADHQGNDNTDAESVLRDVKEFIFLETYLGNRKSFANAASAGLAVFELKPSDKKATKEFNELYEAVVNQQAPNINLEGESLCL